MYLTNDGYPSAVIHLLVELADLLNETKTLRGPNYAAAQFLFVDTSTAEANLFSEPVAISDYAVLRTLEIGMGRGLTRCLLPNSLRVSIMGPRRLRVR